MERVCVELEVAPSLPRARSLAKEGCRYLNRWGSVFALVGRIAAREILPRLVTLLNFSSYNKQSRINDLGEERYDNKARP